MSPKNFFEVYSQLIFKLCLKITKKSTIKPSQAGADLEISRGGGGWSFVDHFF